MKFFSFKESLDDLGFAVNKQITFSKTLSRSVDEAACRNAAFNGAYNAKNKQEFSELLGSPNNLKA